MAASAVIAAHRISATPLDIIGYSLVGGLAVLLIVGIYLVFKG